MDTTTDDVKSFETETTEQLVALVRDEGALPGEREAACWELYRRQDRRAVPALIAALKSRHSTVATTAACALFAFTSKRAVKPLIAALRGAVAWETRCAAAITLLGMGDERAISPLVKTLNDTCEQVDVRGQAAKSLGSLLDRDSVPEGVRTAILRNLEDPAPEVRFWCAYALSQFGDGSVIPHLRRVADDPARVARWRTVGEEANWAISVLQSSTTYGRYTHETDRVSVRYGDLEMYTPNSYSGGYEQLPRAVQALGSAGLDALLLTPGADLFYLTRFEHGHAGERLLCLFLRADGSFQWIAPSMNVSQIDSHGLGGGEIRGWTDAETYLPALREALDGVGSLAFDDEARAAFLMDVHAVAPSVRIVKSGELLRGLRIRKQTSELEAMRAAARTVDETIQEAIALCLPGRRESEIDEKLRKALLKRSPESSVAFTIIASGENSAVPHHETETRKLERGDVVVLDFGTRLDGYHSDITVTCAVGEPADPEVRKVYRTVWEAQQKALEAVRPGVTCEAIDRAAREHISAAGFGEQFLHRTGHGLGLQIHEPPYLVAGNTEVLEEGMVFSIEPGIYLRDRFGVRLEVIASVAADGVSLINAPSAPELPLVTV